MEITSTKEKEWVLKGELKMLATDGKSSILWWMISNTRPQQLLANDVTITFNLRCSNETLSEEQSSLEGYAELEEYEGMTTSKWSEL